VLDRRDHPDDTAEQPSLTIQPSLAGELRENDPAKVVDMMLHGYVEALRARDLDGAMALFAPDATLIGSEPGGSAHSTDELHALHERIFTEPVTYGWQWRNPVATRHGDVIWFAAKATWVIQGKGGAELPYQLSGVLYRTPAERWVFELFNGSRPTKR